MLNILILCTANSARSILGEALINRLGDGRFRAYSAGSHPRGEPNPDGLAMLKDKGYDISAFASKGWDVFAGPDAAKMDIVITVCDSAAGEACPLWPGSPVKAIGAYQIRRTRAARPKSVVRPSKPPTDCWN